MVRWPWPGAVARFGYPGYGDQRHRWQALIEQDLAMLGFTTQSGGQIDDPAVGLVFGHNNANGLSNPGTPRDFSVCGE